MLAATLLGLLPAFLPSSAAHSNDPADCKDFGTSRDAQDYYERYVGDPADLDRDGDGYACDYGPPSLIDTERPDPPDQVGQPDPYSLDPGSLIGYGLLFGIPALVVWGWLEDRPNRRAIARAKRAGTYVKAKGSIWICENGEPSHMAQLVAWEFEGGRWWGLVEFDDGPNRRRQEYFAEEDLQHPSGIE